MICVPSDQFHKVRRKGKETVNPLFEPSSLKLRCQHSWIPIISKIEISLVATLNSSVHPFSYTVNIFPLIQQKNTDPTFLGTWSPGPASLNNNQKMELMAGSLLLQ